MTEPAEVVAPTRAHDPEPGKLGTVTAHNEVKPLERATRTRLRRADIVSASAKIFAADGYAGVGMRDIAEAVGIRGASLYHHFPSKEDILYEICLAVTREPVEENLPLLDAAGTPSRRLADLIAAHIRHLRRRRLEHLVALHERAALTPEHLATIDDYRQYYQRRVQDVLAAGVRSGEFRSLDTKLAALGIMDMLNGVSGWLRGATDDDVQDVVDTYRTLIFGGLRAHDEAAESGAADGTQPIH
ncbi:TetR/AcrR family transcriptional regulator [Nocardia bovistercoris]|uniref:TetR family transcriptional regulator n=1 Tax=Nocardia bovistercoris TaxID=2785916 RepID=A0A931IDG2_9NOCA|nr:TetR/AcrR family transcriptional regulator [Nocardia bovistercoris]MBH0779424.1 TetR family transcriptional regulator [Nocardia bovistercoris]